MFGKLLIYDFSSSFKKYVNLLFIMLIMIILSTIMYVSKNNVIFVVFSIVLIILSVGLSIANLAISALNLYKSLAGKESYFTYTIPVTETQVIFSKFILTLVWNLLSTLFLIIFWATTSLLILKTFGSDEFYNLIEFFKETFNLKIVLSSTSMFLFSLIYQVSFWIFCIVSANIPFFKNRGFGFGTSIIFYFVINFIIGMASFFIGLSVSILNNSMDMVSNEFELFNQSILKTSLINIIFSILFITLSIFITKKHRTI